MKVLKVITAATMLFAAQKAVALGDVSVFGGYTTVNMTALNAQLDLQRATFTPIVAGFGGTVAGSDISSGYYVGADAGFSVLPFLKVGPRIEYLGVGEGTVTVTVPGWSGGVTLDSSVMMYEAGVSGNWELPVAGLSVGGGIWLGYGMASASLMQNTNGPGGTATTDAYSGSGFVSEIEGQVAYKIIPVLSVGLDLGYRIASVSQMTANADDANNGTKAGTALQDSTSTAIPFDFGGVKVGGRVSFNF